MSVEEFEVHAADELERDGVLHFLGPTSLAWLARASALPGRSLHVALALKLQWDLAGRRQFTMQTRLSALFGVDRYAERRALNRLIEARLVRATQRRGARPRVELIDADVPSKAEAK